MKLAGLTNEQAITARLRVWNATGFGPASEPITATPTLWPIATRAGGTGGDQAWAVSALADGSAIVTGSFDGTAALGATTLVSAGGFDAFVAKTNPDGSWDWATRAGGASGIQASTVATLPDGSAIVAGNFFDSATFGSTTLVSAGGADVFVAKTNPNGSWAWATSAGGGGSDSGLGIDTLADGSAIVTGHFVLSANFGGTVLNGFGNTDVFVARVDPSGSWDWVTRAGGTGPDAGLGVGTFADGSAMITGSFNGTATFGSTNLAIAGGFDAFVAKTNPNGSWARALSAGGAGDDQGRGIGTLTDGSAIVTGFFRSTATFGAIGLASAGGNDAFVAKVSTNGAW